MQERIALAIDEMEVDPFQGNVWPLQGVWLGYQRKRVGRYRIIFAADRQQRQVTIISIRSRSDRTY